MKPHILHNGLHRIGNQPNHFIDQERFLGRDPHDDSWLIPSKTPRANILENERTFQLSEQIDAQNIEANFNNGLLSIRLQLRPNLEVKKINVE